MSLPAKNYLKLGKFPSFFLVFLQLREGYDEKRLPLFSFFNANLVSIL